MSSDYLKNLNPPQQEAVEHFLGPILVLAGAGSGKTRVLTHRIIHLVQNHRVNPRRILAVTFTNKATDEMRVRLKQLLGKDADHIWISTFHSAALRILRKHATLLSYTQKFAVYDQDDSKNTIKQILREKNISEKEYPVNSFLRAIDRSKNHMISPENFPRGSSYQQLLEAEIYDEYQKNLLRSDAMDFGDLLWNVVTLFEKHPKVLEQYQEFLKFVLVDEFQDTNPVQYQFLKFLAAGHQNLFAVGDDDQSIYAFRGATIQNILNFEIDFPKTVIVRLEQNYRSTANILNAAHAVIEKNSSRKEKKLWTDGPEGEPITFSCGNDENDEAFFIAREILKRKDSEKLSFRDFAILYRTNAQSRALEDAMIDAGVPYRIYGGLRFYERKEIKDIIAYLRLMVSDNDNQAFFRSVNNPPRGIGAQTLQKIQDHAKENLCSLFSAAVQLADSHQGISKYVQIILSLRKTAKIKPLHTLISEVLKKSEYLKRLESAKDISAISRIENLKEFTSIARQSGGDQDPATESLESFLDRVVLTGGDEVPDQETEEEQQNPGDYVSLATLHLAKGLEFPVVFLTGMEEGLLPHHHSLQEPDGLEEERRLCYVGITRAMKKLYLSRARFRGMFSSGSSGGYREVSRFACDIPPEVIEELDEQFFSNLYHEAIPDIDFNTGDEKDFFDDFLKIPAKKKEKRTDSLVNNLFSADETFSSQQKATLADLKSGQRVTHANFGSGTVLRIEEAKDEKRSKIVVNFDNYENPKKLVFQFAGLSLQ